MTALRDRLAAIVQALPESSAVTLPVAELRQWLAEESVATVVTNQKEAPSKDRLLTADDVAEFLVERDLAASRAERGKLDLLVTDVPKSFREVASRFLGESVEEVHQIDL